MSKILSALLVCLFLVSCTTPYFISDMNAQRLVNTNITHLERVVTDESIKNSSFGIAVLTGTDQDGTKYLAIAPAYLPKSIKSVENSWIRTLTLEQAKSLLHAINYAAENFSKKVDPLESLNSHFQSGIKSESYEPRRNRLAPIINDLMTFSFSNVGGRSSAKLIFEGIYPPYRCERIISKPNLKLLGSLIEKGISNIDHQ